MFNANMPSLSDIAAVTGNDREWDVSRRHYHDSNKSEDKEEMNRHAREHIANTLESIRTIWSSSDPELKKRMKADLTALVGELTV